MIIEEPQEKWRTNPRECMKKKSRSSLAPDTSRQFPSSRKNTRGEALIQTGKKENLRLILIYGLL